MLPSQYTRALILTGFSMAPLFYTHAALEVVEPTALCDRFAKKSEVQACLKLVDQKKPDTYFASACNALEDHKIFMQCLEFAAQAEVDPRQLDSCGKEEFTDQERWGCLKKMAQQKNSKFQRVPANLSPRSRRP